MTFEKAQADYDAQEPPDDFDYDEDRLEFDRDDFESMRADQILAERKEEDLF